MAKHGSMGLGILAGIKDEQARKQADKAAGKASKGDKATSPAYSSDELERLLANTGCIVAADGTVLLKPANPGARKGRAPRLLVEATEEAIDKLCEGLKALIADEATLTEKVESFKAWAAKNPR